MEQQSWPPDCDYAKDHGLRKSAIDDLVIDALKNEHLQTDPEAPHSPSDSDTTMLDPSSANGASVMLQDLAEVAAGVLRA